MLTESKKLNGENGVVLALGFFDCVHKGHRKVISTAKDIAKINNAKTVVFTFSGNLRGAFNKSDREVYSTSERKKLLLSLGIDDIFFAPIDEQFLSMTANSFLEYINSKLNIISYVCGEDYSFGKSKSGDVNFLREYATSHSQTISVIDKQYLDGKIISSTLIKETLRNGDIPFANKMLVDNYSITGNVKNDRGVGKTLGFPTVNIQLPDDKFTILDGVYAGFSVIDGIKYKALINYGARPTFDVSTRRLEAHIIGFSGDLYGREITISFSKYLRDIKKFSNAQELIDRLKLDLELVKEMDV